ncbi:hypothetical protein PVAND_017263 [Polypedilum vanderplanki]|uniref:Uncharacterized protein n=1 Tax=Polypedilum vanderplanki TaxID=319348 RepID=A0A9J6BI71_POLVA|nr:hypothetical protein PVAND_017263 [Polypedilum vanderplanki]
MSDDKGILEKAKEKLIDAKDATKEKLGEIKYKLSAMKGDSTERSKKLYDLCNFDVEPEDIDENVKNFDPFKSDESDEGIEK